MRTASSAFKEKVKSSSRNFINTAVITLASQEELTITNANILFDGFETEDSVGSDNTFDALGSTIINKCSLVLYNGDDNYSDYDFEDAHVVVSTGLDIDGTIEPIQLGVYTIEEANYTANSIVLSLLDNMSKFDRPYSESQLVYPATLSQIVADACTVCGVTFNYADSDFAYDTFSVATKPDVSSCTFRDVISWAATVNGTFARCNSLGQLEFKWFDLSGLPIPTDNITVIDENNVEHENVSLILSDGTLVDTISYMPGKNSALPEVSSLFSQDIAVTDITITGLTITIANIEDAADVTSSIGTDDYRITISDNPFITADNITTVRDQIAERLIDLSFRKCNISCVSNPLLEAGDTAYLIDTKGNEHRILITRITFSPTANQTIVCGADTPNRKSATLYSSDTRTSAQLKAHLRSLRERLVNTETIAGNTNQYFWFTETGTDTGAHITEVPQEEFTDPTSENYHAGYNALFRSIGFAIRNGLTELATFSANSIRLGVSTAKHILINPDGISLYSAANTLLSNFTASGVNLYVQGVLRTVLSNAGLVIYDIDGETTIASFGETSQIGKDDTNHQVIDSTGIQGVNEDGLTVFDVQMDGSVITYAYTLPYPRIDDNPPHIEIKTTTPGSRLIVGREPKEKINKGLRIWLYWMWQLVDTTTDALIAYKSISTGGFLYGYPSTQTVDVVYNDITYAIVTIAYDGYYTFGVNGYITSSAVDAGYFVDVYCESFGYETQVRSPAFSFGTRLSDIIGEFSTIAGENLTASYNNQFACGKYNVDDTKYAFMIGNGDAENGDSNAFAVTWGGNFEIGLDETAIMGTTDAKLYDAITELGWEDEVLI